MFKGIDLFSDTVTKPSAGMKNAMYEAEVGDEQRGEDPSTSALEARVAHLLGKTAAMFFPSATMASQVALCALSERGDELLAAEWSHLFFAESGGPAVHANLMTRPMVCENGIFTGEQVRQTYRAAKGPLFPVSKIVSVENTTNLGGGHAWTKPQLTDVLDVARDLKLRTHMDGSRFFNAVVKTGLSPSDIAGRFDAITLCLSKGLGCPVGALLVFDETIYPVIRRLKQRMGGCLRQSGILAAAGIYALDHNVERLGEDHENARRLAQGLANITYLKLENPNPATNMVFFSWENPKVSPGDWAGLCERGGVRFSQMGEKRFRAVTHLDISESDIDKAVSIVGHVVKDLG